MNYDEQDNKENSTEDEDVEYNPSNGSEKFVKVALILGGIMLVLMIIVIIVLSVAFKQPETPDSGQGTDSTAGSSVETSEGAVTSGGIVTLEDGSKDFNGLVVSPVKTQKNGDTLTLTGTVVNKKPRILKFVQVEINLYDANGTYLNTTVDSVDGLEEGALWRFSAPVNDIDFVKCEVANVTAW